jgi:hypothetical protein
MRLGHLWEARATFLRVLDKWPSHRITLDNLDELMRMLPGREPEVEAANNREVVEDAYIDESQRLPGFEHVVVPLPRIPIDRIDDPEFDAFKRGTRPFVITGLYNSSEWERSIARRKWGFRYFRQVFRERNVDFYPGNMATVGVRPMIVTMDTALREAASPSGNYPTK